MPREDVEGLVPHLLQSPGDFSSRNKQGMTKQHNHRIPLLGNPRRDRTHFVTNILYNPEYYPVNTMQEKVKQYISGIPQLGNTWNSEKPVHSNQEWRQIDFNLLRDSTNESFTIYQMIRDLSLEYNLHSLLYDGMENLDKIHGTMLNWLGLKNERNEYVKYFP
ncbi:hypothetical protein PGT21_013300 [Puccinia graminis f. sp. tritici]|uniref:Uncharacterized protein n=1 Tax=Puccinia graminis f. sp. tritici TaxID=56615 RepID=A0A5B0RLG4_PUCGR|nr:hypothetical protein PGT21_013300 [Puccinia graminis f. sp. tritici]KAA1126781.1 hypothetical protein PGTUg99_019554 [Puccinia graminis f. sp. tritici]